eukprot:TRINITY_DN2489_c0_g2_i1.p1 TRINITY_DN2489_c0_g2~~TRINITY_DN2489_c0_g2_i1.p1  ORF type:complete len:316 (-),score=73.44 TRINITY_DN2489_c0_g2_i1:157-1077(-)
MKGNSAAPNTPFVIPTTFPFDYSNHGFPIVLPYAQFSPFPDSSDASSVSSTDSPVGNAQSMNSQMNNPFFYSQFGFQPIPFGFPGQYPFFPSFQVAPVHNHNAYPNNSTSIEKSMSKISEKNKAKKSHRDRPDYQPCCAKNKKTGKPCRNPALMEYIGEKPEYCAEHIESDPSSIYCKCRSNFGKEIGDGKRCKEVVLKEFMFCSKHLKYHYCDLQTDPSALPEVRSKLARCKELYNKLSQEIQIVRHSNQILFYRKSKLLPKYEKLCNDLQECVDRLEQLQASPIKVNEKESLNVENFVPSIQIN